MRVAGLRWLKVRGFSGGGTAPAVDCPTPSSTPETTGGRGRRSFASANGRRSGLAGLLATLLVAGVFGGALSGAFPSSAGATTNPACTTTHTNVPCAATLTVTPPAALGAHGNAANRFSAYGNGGRGTYKPTTPLGSVTATVSPAGAITGVTIPKLYYHLTPSTINTHSTETIVISQPTAGTTSGTINSTGVVTLDASLLLVVTVKSPATQKCRTSPHVVLQSTSPYNATTKSVTLSDTTFTIPNFTPSTCGLAGGTLDRRFAGSTGNELTLGFHGTLPIPPPPAAATTTTLTATPAGSSLAGTSVTLKATVTSTTSGTFGATGATVKFMNGATEIGAPQPLTTGVATLTTPSLPVGPGQQLTAVYSGNSAFTPSTSASVSYTVQPSPAVTVTLPATVTGNATTTATGTLKFTDPTAGVSYPQLFVQIGLAGIRNTASSRYSAQYQDTAGTWCTLLNFTGSDTTITGMFAGQGSSCTLTYPASFPLTAGGTALSVPFRITYHHGAFGAYGLQAVTATLFTGVCTSATACTPLAPLDGTAAPVGSASIHVLPTTKLVSRPHDGASRRATSTVHNTFNVALVSVVQITTTTTTPTATSPNLPAPTGTVSYTVDGQPLTTVALPASTGAASATPLFLYNTATLSIGNHTLVSIYSGDAVYDPSTLTETFTVIAAPSGTLFSCIANGVTGSKPITPTLPAYVTVSSSPVPGVILATSTKTITASATTVSVEIDPAALRSHYNTNQSTASLGFSPNNSIVTSTAITFTGTTGTASAIVGSWTESAGSPITLTVPVRKGTAPGTKITIAEDSIAFSAANGVTTTTWDCMPNPTAASLAAVTVAGATLAASPASPQVVGTTVTLTAAVYPTPTGSSPASHVTFLDGATVIGTSTVSNTGPTAGNASITVKPALGDHTYVAKWSGTTTVPSNTSNTLTYSVRAGPAVTTQPSSQTVTAGQTASFSVAASGTPAPTVQWQLSTDGGAQWTTISGATETTYTTPATTGAQNGDQYRAVFTNAAGTADSNAATLTVTIPPPPAPPVTTTTTTTPATSGGYHLVAANGSVYSYGGAPFYGSMGGQTLNKPIVGTASTPGDGGYWLVASDGGIFSFGNAAFYGSMGGKPLNQPIVGMASTFDGKGYWEVASDGGIFAFGDAQFYGSMGGKSLNKPIVGIAATPDGKGYWEVASDGGIFAFGDAQFYGSTGSLTLNKPIVGMASTATGAGYWLVAADGGVFAFGNAGFHGTVAGTTSASIVSLVPTGDNGGYWETASNGQVFQFGDATSAGTALTQTATIVAMSD
jgi:Bacterial Ig-like domain (group 3)/Immunoglobulin I-set domain